MQAQAERDQRVSPTPQGGGAPETLRIWLLGGFKVSVNSRSIGDDQWRLRNARSLLKLLALAPGHRLHREQVMETLWPDLGIRKASNNLHQILHAARRTLEPAALASGIIFRVRGVIGPSPRPCSADGASTRCTMLWTPSRTDPP